MQQHIGNSIGGSPHECPLDAFRSCLLGRMTSKPEVIPETKSLHYPPKVQGCSRRRILYTRTLNFLIGVRKVCATGLHETTPNCTTLAAASNASFRKCWSTRTCKSAGITLKIRRASALGGSTPPPGTT